MTDAQIIGPGGAGPRQISLAVPAGFAAGELLARNDAATNAAVLRTGEAVIAAGLGADARQQADAAFDRGLRAQTEVTLRAADMVRGAAAERPDDDAGPALRRELADMRAQLAALLGRGVAADKGAAGEDFVRATLERQFPGCDVRDRSREAGRGDLLLELPGPENRGDAASEKRGGLRARGGSVKPPGATRILVECKNVARIARADVDKFERDAREAADAGAAVFVSLTDSNIPRLGRFAVRTFDTAAGVCPAVYVTDVFERPSHLHFAVEAARALARAAGGGGPEDAGARVGAAGRFIAASFRAFSAQAAAAGKMRVQIAALARAAEEMEAAAVRMASEARGAAERLGGAADVEPAAEKAIAAECAASGAAGPDALAGYHAPIRAFFEEHGRKPRRDEVLAACGLQDAQLRKLGGSKRLVDGALARPQP